MTWLLLQAAAITLIITEGSVFQWLRTSGPALWRQLWSCSLCLGTWVGMATFVLHSPGGWHHYGYWLQVLGFGCVSGVLAYTGAAIWAVLDHHSGPDQQVQPTFVPRPMSVKPGKPSPEVLKKMQELREKAAKTSPPFVGQ